MKLSDFRKNKYLIGLCIIIVFWGTLHLTFAGLFSDDEWFLDMITNATSLKSLLIERYNTWTSRLFTEAVCFILVEKPFGIWIILDILVIALLYHSVAVLIIDDKESNANMLLAFVMAGYPFMHMASAGWISTTLNYLWPFAFAMYALTGALRRLRGQKVPVYKYVLYVLALLFAVNCELSAAYVFLIFGGIILYGLLFNNRQNDNVKTKIDLRKYLYEIGAMLISLVGMIFAFTCPGNAIRTEIEVRWMPEFPNLNIIEKARLCAVFVYEHFVAIPDVLFFLFSLLLAFIGVKKKNKFYQNVIALLPVSIDVVYTGIYFVKNFIIGHKKTYDFSFPSIYLYNTKTAIIQISELAGLVVFITATIIVILKNFPEIGNKYIAIWALGSGFAVRMSLMLSATMFISWHRTLIYFYFAMIFVIVMMIQMINKNKKWQLYVCRIIIICGAAVNLFLTIGHQLRIK